MNGNLDAIREMLVDPNTVTGLADAGAHVKLICDGSAPTSQITPLGARPVPGAKRIALEVLVEKQTRRNARLYGLPDPRRAGAGHAGGRERDRTSTGLPCTGPVAQTDLPAGGWRFVQPVTGYVATIVAGVQTRLHDTDTGERPGRLLRRPGAAG